MQKWKGCFFFFLWVEFRNVFMKNLPKSAFMEFVTTKHACYFQYSWTFYIIVRSQVLFCSTEIGRTSFVRQLEPDWHIDSNSEITSQLAVIPLTFWFAYASKFLWLIMSIFTGSRDLSNISFIFLQADLNDWLQMFSVLHPWNISLDVFDILKTVGCANASYAASRCCLLFSLHFDVGYITYAGLAISNFCRSNVTPSPLIVEGEIFL